MELAGTLDNSGRIELDGGGYFSATPTVGGAGIVILAGGVTLQGVGQIALLGGTISGSTGGATLTNVDNTISGFGKIGDGSADLTLVNETHGIIDGNDTSLILDTLSGNGTVTLGNAVAVKVLDGDQLTMRASITNTDSISLESTGDATTLLIDARGVTLNGGGAIDLSDNSNNIITGATPGAELDSVDNTISGSGQLGDGSLTVVNEQSGIIDASGTNAKLVIDTQGSIFTNDGTLEATGGAGLLIENTTVDSSGGGNVSISASGGTVELQNSELLGGNIDGLVHVTGGDNALDGTNGTLTIDATGDVEVLDGQQLTLRGSIGIDDGGVLKLDASGEISVVNSVFDGTQDIVTNTGDVVVGDGQQLTLAGTIGNASASAVINIDAGGHDTTLSIAGTVTLEGAAASSLTQAHIELSDDADNIIAGSGTGATLINEDTISGAGTIDGSNLSLSNQKGSLIDANGTNALDLDFQGSSFAHAGAIEATGAVGLTIEGDVKNVVHSASGLTNGLIEANGGNVSVSGDITGGEVGIVDATFEVSGALSADVTFFTSTGMLKLGSPASFTGKISGFTGNGTLAVRIKSI